MQRTDATIAAGSAAPHATDTGTTPELPAPEGVAIIGMACRFPGAETIARFWRNLQDGVESITHFTDEQLDRSVIDPAELRDPKYVKARAVLPGIDRFDARFFDFSPREAAITDPQQRLLLECAWEAFESAGYDPTRESRPIGCFAGAGPNGYLLYNLASAGHLWGTVNTFQAISHNKNDHVATRLAYKLNLRGPAVTVQTACSTSLVSVVLACQSLLGYQCDLALAGGSTITIPQHTGYLYTERGIGSPDGHCRAFDAQAQGTVGGSGVGVVILKRLADALAEGDTIHAVILGGALNNDGSFKVGYTAPSIDGQAEVIATAQALAGVHPETISYVEAHGTGTPLGDPIEIQALSRAFGRHTQKRQYCAVGSVKTQIGHLDTAAGVAGLIKTVLALGHRQLPPSLHFVTPNPEIDFANSPFYVNATLRDWPAGETPRRAGVSSFGLGGTNAHVVLEEAPPASPSGPGRPRSLLLWSAKSEAALENLTAELAKTLRGLGGHPPETALLDIAYTLHIGRKPFPYRRMLVAGTVAEAAELLETLQPERVYTRYQEPVQRPLTFMFPGQGAQHPGMGAALYQHEPVFREAVDECLHILGQRHELSLRELLLANPSDPDARQALTQTSLAQPALFVIGYALAALWRSFGLAPTSLVGHSVGEYVAACLAGVFTLADALGLIAARGRLIQRLPGGAMLVVPLAEAEVRTLLGDTLALAAVNGPELCVVSGPHEAVESLLARLTARGVISRRLHTSHAFHSAMMDPILAEFREHVARVPRSAPTLPFLSNVTGTWINPEQACDPDYWTQHLRQTVRFGDNLAELLANPEAVLLEVGPGRTLRTIARWNPGKKPAQLMLASLPHPEEGQTESGTEVDALLHAAGQLWLAGLPVDAAAFHASQTRRRCPLPTYPFERERHWVELRTGAGAQGAAALGAARPLTGTLDKRSDIARWFYVPVWQQAPRAPVYQPGPGASSDRWLILTDTLGLGAALAAELSQAGHAVVTAPATARDDAATLLSGLQERGQFPRRIVYLGALAGDASLQGSFYGLLALAQALGALPPAVTGIGVPDRKPLLLDIITENAQEVIGGDLTAPEQAAVRGPALVIPREYPGVRCRHIDLAGVSATLSQASAGRRLVRALAEELLDEAGEGTVAYRRGHRFVQGFSELPLAEPSATAPPLRRDGVYLITGGLGGLGLTVAEDLAQTLGARLVLVGRTALPPRAEWPAVLTGTDAALRQKIRRLTALEALAGEVLYFQADVGDPAAMRRVVEHAQARFGALHGVIHAAGVPGGGMIQRRTAEEARTVLWPKVEGTRAIGQATADLALDFLVLCSSLTTAVPRFGQVDYTAANAFMDAFAAQQACAGRPVLAIDWGAWEEVGMAARHRDASVAASPAASGSGHPLLERCLVKTPGRAVFATDFHVDKHWVLDEHRILGNPVIPGVAYFEMVRAALGEQAVGCRVQFDDVYFLAPLRVRDGETREVRLVIEPEGEQRFRFAIRAREGGGGNTARLRDFTMGTVTLLGSRPEPGRTAGERRLDIAALRERCNVEELLLAAEQREEDLGPRWHSVQRVYLGRNEVLLLLELPVAFAGDFDHMKFHPALLDRAAGIAKNFLAREGNYLPLTYKKLTIHEPLQRKIYSYARFHEAESADRETITFDIALLDEHGRVLVDIERFTQKRVNDPGSELRALAAATAAAAGSPSSSPGDGGEDPDDAARSGEILPAEGTIALRRILAFAHQRGEPARIVVSVRDLATAIAHTDQVIQARIEEAAAAANADRLSLAAGDARPRPHLDTEYVAPRNEIEQRIAAAWQEILGIERVGIHDNFFDLGGDSVQAIQIIAKAGHAGVQLNPQQFFQYATIAELGEMLASILAKQADQGVYVGPVPLTPAQHARLADPAVALDYDGLLFELAAPLDSEALRQALKTLLRRHDALRLRIFRNATGTSQVGATLGETVPLAEVVWTEGALDDERLPDVITAAARTLQLEEGPALTMTWIHRGLGHPDLLLLLAHRVLVDAASWPILLGDLHSACQPHAGPGNGGLVPATGFRIWAERLLRETGAACVKASSHWLDPAWSIAATLPGARSTSPGNASAAFAVALPPEQTCTLVEQTQAALRATPAELVTAGLLMALAEVGGTGDQPWCIAVTGDGRHAFADLDMARTVGPLVATWPVLLQHPSAPPNELLQAVKTQLRPDLAAAASYDFLRMGLADTVKVDLLAHAEIELYYHGSLDALVGAAPTMVGAGCEVTWIRRPALGSGRRLRVEAWIGGGQLKLELVYDPVACTASLIEQLAQGFVRALKTLIEHGRAGESAVSPTDFPLADLDAAQLGALAELIQQADLLDP